MLTVNRLKIVYAEGWDLVFRKEPHPVGIKGDIDPGIQEIRIYLPHITSREDEYRTVLHELSHAFDEELPSAKYRYKRIKGAKHRPKDRTNEEDKIEREVDRIFRNRRISGLIEFLWGYKFED